MKKEQIYEWSQEICERIPGFFESDECIKKHLDAFVTWYDKEWFNIALILYQKPDATIVNSKQSWQEITDKDFYIKMGEKGIRVIVPYIGQKEFNWKSAIVWDIDQCQDKLEVGIVSKLRICVEEIFSRDLWESITDSEELINYIMKKSRHYIHKSLLRSDKATAYIKKCIRYILSSYIPIEPDDTSLSLKHIKDKSAIHLYCSLKAIMSNLDCFLIDYYTEKNCRAKERAEIEYARKIWNMTIHERIENARRIVVEINRKNTPCSNENYDFEEPTGKERRIF